jgi:iron complex outermembrane receptor protein
MQYMVSPDIMVYANYSYGFKGAALNLLNFLTAAEVASGEYRVAPEIPTDYEVGFHATILDRRLQISGALFDETFRDFQATARDPATNATTLVSAGRLRSRGVELEAVATPMRGLDLSASVALTDARFTNFPDAPCYPGELLAPGSRCHLRGTSYVQNLAGEPLNNAPRWALVLGAAYAHSLGWRHLNGYADVNYAYRSKVSYSLNDDPDTGQGGYGVVNVNVGVQLPFRHLRIGLFARNLFDTRFAAFIDRNGFQTGGASIKAGYIQYFSEGSRRTVGVALDGAF